METIIIATDFSEPAYNAAKYASEFCAQLGTERIILYHSYGESPVVTDSLMGEKEDVSSFRDHSLAALEQQEAYLRPYLRDDVSVELVADDRPLLQGINRLAESRGATLLVAGITGKGRLEKFFVGSNTITLARKSPIPLLLVPGQARYRVVRKAVLACDLEKVAQSIPANHIKQLVIRLEADLLVLNVGDPAKGFDIDIIPEQYTLHELFDELKPEYYYTDDRDAVEGIMKFVSDQDAGLIITIPKNHGFFESLFHRSVTKALAHHTTVPLFLPKAV